MSRKIYGFCEAGCKYEVPPKDKFDEVYEKVTNVDDVPTQGSSKFVTSGVTKQYVDRVINEAETELETILRDNFDRYTSSTLNDGDYTYIYDSANPGNIGFKLPTAFDTFRGGNGYMVSGWSGNLIIEYTLNRTHAGTIVDTSGDSIEIPFGKLWGRRVPVTSPFGGNTIYSSYEEVMTSKKYVYSALRINDGEDVNQEAYFTIKFKINIDNNGWIYLSDLKIFCHLDTGIKELEALEGTYHYTGLTVEIDYINFFK